MLHQFQILDILFCNTYCRLKEIIRQESCYGRCECVDSQHGSVVSSMSGWPCHSDAASVCPSVCRSGAVKREPSGGGNDTWTARLEQAEEARIDGKKKGNLLYITVNISGESPTRLSKYKFNRLLVAGFKFGNKIEGISKHIEYFYAEGWNIILLYFSRSIVAEDCESADYHPLLELRGMMAKSEIRLSRIALTW